MNPGALDIDKIAKPLASFLIAFAIGVTSFNFGMLAFFLIEQEAKTDSSVLPPTPSVIDEFAPEFTDLPDFREIEYKKPKGKLIEILNDGIYRRSEVVARHRENWLVLTDSGGSFSLVASLASIKALKTVSWPGDEPDARLSFGVPGPQHFAVKGLKQLQPGPVLTLQHHKLWSDDGEDESNNNEITNGFRKEFSIGDRVYILRTSLGLTNDGTNVAVFVIESDNVSQILKYAHHVPTHDRDIIGSLLWVGDLDKDGKLDLYFDEFNEKGYTGTELHLSSEAEPGKLVGLAADFGLAGC